MNLHDPSQNDCGTHAPPVSRREFLGHVTAGAMAVPLLGSALAGCAQHAASSGRGAASSRVQSGHNIIFTDQERYFRRWPAGLALPARARLRQTGVTFHNHYCPATMCTSSRSVLLTGLQTADTGMFENTDLPWIKNLSPSIPTVGHMLRKAGYYTAYKGKWHLNRDFDREADRLLERQARGVDQAGDRRGQRPRDARVQGTQLDPRRQGRRDDPGLVPIQLDGAN